MSFMADYGDDREPSEVGEWWSDAKPRWILVGVLAIVLLTVRIITTV